VATTTSPEETEAAGEALGRRLRKGDLVLLEGELGAGKTTFVRGIARGTGATAPVASPTFQLVRIYPGRLQLAHVDLYRIENNSELAELGLDELADDGAVVVEWGDRLTSPLVGRSGEFLGPPRSRRLRGVKAGVGVSQLAVISIEHLGGDRRLIRTKRDLSH
jgi:tRNA threonylcarbamoyladenosine biosynthesis protein TsaE